MTHKTCEVCSGARIIHLPVFMELASSRGPVRSGTAGLNGVVRTYPCPECSPVMPLEHFIEVQSRVAVDLRGFDNKEKAFALARNEAADFIAEQMVKGGLIGWHEHADARPSGAELNAKAFVAPPGRGEGMRGRLRATREALAERVIVILLEKFERDGLVPMSYARSICGEALKRASDEVTPPAPDRSFSGVV